MGLLNYIKGTIKENYDLEDIEDIEDIDDFVYDDEQNTGEEQNADNSRTEDLTGLVSEFEKNYQKHEKKAKAPQKKNKKVSSEEKIQEQRRKAKEEEKKYDELLNSVQAKSLIHVVDKMNQAGTQENYSGKLAKEEKEETEYLKQLEKEEEKKVLILFTPTFLPFGQEVSLAQRARSIPIVQQLKWHIPYRRLLGKHFDS